jgi:Na+/H+-dicarboxylate symporter
MILKFKPGLLTKIVIAIIIGIGCSHFFPVWAVRAFVTINGLFSNFLAFIIPLLILGLIAPGIADLGKGAGKLLIITVLIAYGSTVFAGFFSYFTTKWSLPMLIEPSSVLNGSGFQFSDVITAFFTFDMTPLMGVTTALVLAFVIGIGVSAVNGERLKGALGEFRDIIILIIQRAIIPLLPYYIFGIFLKIGAEGQVTMILSLFFKVVIVIFIMHIVLLLFQFIIAGAVSEKILLGHL